MTGQKFKNLLGIITMPKTNPRSTKSQQNSLTTSMCTASCLHYGNGVWYLPFSEPTLWLRDNIHMQITIVHSTIIPYVA